MYHYFASLVFVSAPFLHKVCPQSIKNFPREEMRWGCKGFSIERTFDAYEEGNFVVIICLTK